MANKFVIRVYGILLKDNAVLVSDETVMGKFITKFPGGGLEFGEGTIECLQREFFEELTLKVDVTGHFYTTDFYVPSAFDPNVQVISVYYLVNPIHPEKLNDLHSHGDKKQTFRWIELSKLKDLDVTLVIDKKVVNMMIERFRE
jgi:8-oxo-dGTP diphosphatase